MQVVVNQCGWFSNPKLNHMRENKSEFEWRTDEKIIKLVGKRLSEIKFLSALARGNVATETQKARLSALTSYPQNWLYFGLEDVDTTRKWTIIEYDTAYYVQYLKEGIPELNYMELS